MNRANSTADTVEDRRKSPSPQAQRSRSRAACTKPPTGMRENDNSFQCRVRLRLCLTHAITHAANGVNELDRERLVDLPAQVPYVDIHNICHGLEALVPHVIEDHGSREHSAG